MPAKPVAEVTVLPVPRDSAAQDNVMTTSRVEADARAFVWPQMCCCCGGTTGLDLLGIYSNAKFGNTRALIFIPYCRRCQSHDPPAWARASAATTAAVIFRTAQPTAWRFRFYSRAYAEQFAAVNPGGYLTTLYLN